MVIPTVDVPSLLHVRCMHFVKKIHQQNATEFGCPSVPLKFVIGSKTASTLSALPQMEGGSPRPTRRVLRDQLRHQATGTNSLWLAQVINRRRLLPGREGPLSSSVSTVMSCLYLLFFQISCSPQTIQSHNQNDGRGTSLRHPKLKNLAPKLLVYCLL